MYNYNNLSPFRVWCQKVLPLVYEESLSYYETLCKLVYYINSMLADLEKMGADIDELNTSFVQLKTYVDNYFTNLDVQEEINNKLDEMAVSGALDAIIGKYASNINQFNCKRLWRQILPFNSGAQAITYTGSTYIIAGGYADDTAQSISEYSLDGNLMRSVTYTSTSLGHLNGIAFYNGKLYCVNGSTNSDITVIDYTTLAIESSFTPSGYTNIYSVCVNDNKIYLLGYVVSDTPLILEFVPSTQNISVVSSFSNPTNPRWGYVRQGFCVIGNTAYICYNRENIIQKVNVNTGYTEAVINVSQGNDVFPIGELECPVNVNGQLMFLAISYLSSSERNTLTVQLFASNIGGVVYPNSPFGQSINNSWNIFVNQNNTSNNPQGTESNAFSSLEECCAFMQHNNQYSYNLKCVNFSSNDAFQISGVNCFVDFNNKNVKYVAFDGGNFTVYNASVQNQFYLLSSNCVLNNVDSSLFTARNSTITAFACNILSYDLKSCSFNPGRNTSVFNSSISLDNSSIINCPAWPFNASISSTETTVSWSPFIYQVVTQNNRDLTVMFSARLGNIYAPFYIRLTATDLLNIKNNTPVAAYGTTTFASPEPVTVNVKFTINSSDIKMSVFYAYNIAANTDVTASTSISLFDFRALS